MLHSPRALWLLVPILLSLPLRKAEAEEAPRPDMPPSWLVIQRVDTRARRPFNPDAVFHRYLLARDSAPPTAGSMVRGTAGEATWARVGPDAKGRVGRGGAWAYAALEAPADRIVMASLLGGATLFVNGTPHVGSIYGDAFAVPVKLIQGTNHLFVRGIRGAFSLVFTEPPAPLFVASFRQTKPDAVVGEALDTVVGLVVVNASEATADDVVIAIHGTDRLEASSSTPDSITPLGILQIPVRVSTKQDIAAPAKGAPQELTLNLDLTSRGKTSRDEQVTLPVVSADAVSLRTFVSSMDGSVQRYAVRRPSGSTADNRPKGLVLSLHGASVGPRAQAKAYAPKADFWLFAPTNRDRFGFDWQDWGRLDAYEVLAEGLRLSGVDRKRVYLTGHSMGGHGTWHLGANDPDGFAAIAPSAGWISFDTYPGPRPTSQRSDLWHAADGASLTRSLLDNLVQLPTFILHGTTDDNVPLAQAQEMESLLTKAGGKPTVHYEVGKGHWWDGHPEPGTQCVDWPGFYAMFRETTIPSQPNEVHFTTVHPSMDWKHHWIEVHQFVDYGKPAKVQARWDPATRLIHVTTENVRAFKMSHTARRKGMRVNALIWDAPGTRAVWWSSGRAGARMSPAYAPPILAKRPGQCGPFKRAWTNRFVMIYGTAGTDEDDLALLEQARFDAQRWTYRANGRALLVSDGHYASHARQLEARRRNAILYGNRTTNAAMRAEGRSLPVSHSRLMTKALRREGGGVCSVHGALDGPRQVGIVGSADITASRTGFSLMLFVSGAGWPDYTLWNASVLTEGDAGVSDAGFYDANWLMTKVKPGRALRERRVK